MAGFQQGLSDEDESNGGKKRGMGMAPDKNGSTSYPAIQKLAYPARE